MRRRRSEASQFSFEPLNGGNQVPLRSRICAGTGHVRDFFDLNCKFVAHNKFHGLGSRSDCFDLPQDLRPRLLTLAIASIACAHIRLGDRVHLGVPDLRGPALLGVLARRCEHLPNLLSDGGTERRRQLTLPCV
jgi:hypothetical protein